MKELLKAVARNYLPHKYMKARRERQKVETLKEQNEPLIYNSRGEIKRVFYIDDTVSGHAPYTIILGQNPDYIFWDRFNVGLPIQFYTCERIDGKTNAYAKKRMAFLSESEAIRPEDYENLLSHPEIAREYDRIFTFSDRVLERYENALFVPASGLWYGSELNGGEYDHLRYQKKTKNISTTCSAKAASEYHRLRQALAKAAVDAGMADGYGKFFGRYVEKKAETLDDYRYSIVVENDVKPLYFTEKIMDCFASMTVPIYVGATRIGDYFNTDGIVLIEKKDYDNIAEICKRCNQTDYESRKDAIIDNYNRVMKYRCVEDYIYTNYTKEFQV